METQSLPSLVRDAFALSHLAKVLRGTIEKKLPALSGKDHAVAHRAYTTLNDFALGFESLESKIAELRALGRYQI